MARPYTDLRLWSGSRNAPSPEISMSQRARLTRALPLDCTGASQARLGFRQIVYSICPVWSDSSGRSCPFLGSPVRLHPAVCMGGSA